MVKIKICGLSRPEDIEYVNDARPDFCGFIIQVPASRRNVTVEQLRRLRESLSERIRAVSSCADMVLLDHGKGGTGERFDWTVLEQYRNRGNEPEKPFLLAGGIGPDNISEAVRRCSPFGVDLSSAVETDGKKDREKIMAAVAAVRSIAI